MHLNVLKMSFLKASLFGIIKQLNIDFDAMKYKASIIQFN